ncbi:hypothetical protein Ferp_2047 [Ferroglobus placidus DSM 10642]|uniref:Uncharacterized protein n=1 Tax=Ferroglobus placidus (strain DSM 10642 / AEDII12DO) TaxID=589924 RepID=D3S0B8_FERPA|nr:hypothetical protein [Ferroglobus placidus]ADC66181.1 hypothetical protein Ferp_2047 [Ferroglobus placidus DSM 10642]
MKCPHCGQYIENTLWEALQPYKDRSGKVVITNIDAVLEVGPRIVAIFEEKNGHLRIRGYQAVTLKKIARCLRVPLFYIEREGDQVKLYEYDTSQKVESSPFLKASQLLPVFSGSVEEFGEYIFSRFISQAPPSREENPLGGGRGGRKR